MDKMASGLQMHRLPGEKGITPTVGGLPALSGSGDFLLKDVLLPAAAVWILGEALRRAQEYITN